MNLLQRIYAKKHLGRALALTAVALIALSYLSVMLPGGFGSLLGLLWAPAFACLVASPIVGIINLATKNKQTPDGNAAAPATPARGVTRYLGRLLSAGGILFMFSPLMLAAATTQPGHNMWSEGDSGSGGAAIWLMLITLPLGSCIIVAGIVVGIYNMSRRNQR